MKVQTKRNQLYINKMIQIYGMIQENVNSPEKKKYMVINITIIITLEPDFSGSTTD